eukprot:TRINITY_DN3943_c0_g1_i1.p1 TRINITY_DN3943_c0_g1~~TRINITY_DN3943_c0_g1_i1.p1  ORF type:complete len:513 (-),score=133.40 TRINITY_DN3943_c0_g1_i1:133-1671(-)
MKCGFLVLNTVLRGKRVAACYQPRNDDKKDPYDKILLNDVNTENLHDRTSIVSILEKILENYLKHLIFVNFTPIKEILGLDALFLADIFSPRNQLSDKTMELTIENHIFLNHPIFFQEAKYELEEPRNSTDPKGVSKSSNNNLISLNVVFVICADCPPYKKEKYKKNLCYFAKALALEEIRNKFVSTEATQMLKLSDEHINFAKNLIKNEAIIQSDSKDPSGLLASFMSAMSEKSAEQIAKSSLSKLVNDFFEKLGQIKEQKVLSQKIKVNQLPQKILEPLHDMDVSRIKRNLKPYQTITFTKSFCKMAFDSTSSPRFKDFIQRYSPGHSFYDNTVLLEMGLDEVLSYAAHLIYWDLGKVCNALLRHNVFTLNPNWNFANLKAKDEEFRTKFMNEKSLADLITSFSERKYIYEHIKELGMMNKTFYNIVIWMLQESLIIELNAYVYLKGDVSILMSDPRDRKLLGKYIEAVIEFNKKNVCVNEICLLKELNIKTFFEFVGEKSEYIGLYFHE